MKKPSKTRYNIEWSEEDKDLVKQQLKNYDYLDEYTFDD